MKDFEPVNKEEEACVRKAANIITSTIAIPCTGCRYCVDETNGGYPMNINIPRMFELYNESKRYGVASFKWNYNEELKKSGNPAECVGCGNCEGHCPQKISIIEQLKTVAKTFG
jgi:predicted aldo/keto reductase-like oxidoreductase